MTAATALAVLLPAAPGAAGLTGLLLRPAARRVAAAFGLAGTGVALGAAILLLTAEGGAATAGVRLADLGAVTVTVGVRADPVAAAVSVAVAVVALLVQLYSVGYLRGDRRYAPYAAQISLFTAAMLTVVLATDLIQLLVGWEVMGICSYLLIGHDRALPAAPAAAVKAFLVTRIGDVGFWLGVVLLGTGAGSFQIQQVLAEVGSGDLSQGRVTAAGLLLLAGVAGKSAQFPLHTWLPDAMAGPTPVSALIHAATMVAAGIYVVVRLSPLFVAAPTALAVLGVVASVTMLLGALAACAQDDIKRILAYSTISQVAYMAAALSVGADGAALFHLLSHAAFKALLFLAAGSVIRATGSSELSRLGGLRRALPVTFATTTVGLAALAGVPPFAGFWSKDSVLSAAAAATAAGPAPRWTAWLVLLAGLATSAITAWYATRLWLCTFFGPAPTSSPREPGRLLLTPMLLLSVPAALLGALVLAPVGGRTDHGWFAHAPLPSGLPAPPTGAGPGAVGATDLDPVTLTLGLVLAAAGALAVLLAWRRAPGTDPAWTLGPARPLLASAFRVDDAQQALVVRPVYALAATVRAVDERVIGGAVDGSGTGARWLGLLLARRHTGLPRYLSMALAGAALLGALAVVLREAW